MFRTFPRWTEYDMLSRHCSLVPGSWLNHSPTFTLRSAFKLFQSSGLLDRDGFFKNLKLERAAGSLDSKTVFQRCAYDAIFMELRTFEVIPYVNRRLRKLSSNESVNCMSALRTGSHLFHRAVPQRILNAVLSTWLNAWISGYRNEEGISHCPFCNFLLGSATLKHFSECKSLNFLSRHFLKLPLPHDRVKFLALANEPPEFVAKRALHLYLAKGTFDRCRKSSFHSWWLVYRGVLMQFVAKYPNFINTYTLSCTEEIVLDL
jgi:hypothetical protein